MRVGVIRKISTKEFVHFGLNSDVFTGELPDIVNPNCKVKDLKRYFNTLGNFNVDFNDIEIAQYDLIEKPD